MNVADLQCGICKKILAPKTLVYFEKNDVEIIWKHKSCEVMDYWRTRCKICHGTIKEGEIHLLWQEESYHTLCFGRNRMMEAEEE